VKYEKQITEAFERLNYMPRPGQLSAVNQVLEAFVDEKVQNVVLNASTGAGKSIIGAVTAEALSSIKGLPTTGTKSSVLLTATNVLAKQYYSTFDALEKQGKFIMIKGASNYECTALSTPEEEANGETCAWFTMVQNASEFQEILDNHCERCELRQIKARRNSIRHLATNYSYYFIDRMYTGKLEDRHLIVWDEAHLVNDLFSEHNAIFFSQKTVQKWAQEIADTVGLTDLGIAKNLKSVSDDLGKKNKIHDGNYEAYLRAMLDIYRYAKQRGVIAQERALRAGEMGKYNKLTRFVRAYEGRACKIDDMFKYDYDRVFEYKEDEKAVSVKPVFVGTMIDALQAAEHNLFMSATVSGEFMVRTCNLDETKTKFIKLPPSFPRENKEVVFFEPLALNYTSLQDQAVVKKLTGNVSRIVKKHVDEGQRGIILAPSFKLAQAIAADLPKTGFRLFEQRQGEKLEHVLAAFKGYTGGPAVLLSPALFEGVDLPGDLSRFQILVKAPFPSLGDKRMKYILDRYPSIYNAITIMKIVQGAGRSIRSPEDHAVTYILDKNAERLFNSKQNVWKDEFNVRFTSFL
jgi:Rad3-related DNA helicase